MSTSERVLQGRVTEQGGMKEGSREERGMEEGIAKNGDGKDNSVEEGARQGSGDSLVGDGREIGG